jgi:hypothetical protein
MASETFTIVRARNVRKTTAELIMLSKLIIVTFGNLAIMGILMPVDPWLCVPAFQQVCRLSFVTLLLQLNQKAWTVRQA